MCLPGCGASILEISHRSAAFLAILEDCQERLRNLLAIPADYQILFLQGGSRVQFSMVPMNLVTSGLRPGYIVTGSWGKKAREEAQRLGEAETVADTGSPYRRLPDGEELQLTDQLAFVHFTSNETIQGVQFATEPEVGELPLVCDASSDFLHRPIDVSRYGLIYACAQKNAGPAGVTIVIVRKDLLNRIPDDLPGGLDYRSHAENNSLWNTPPTFAIYVTGLVVRWLQEEVGGLENMAARNREKAALLYDVLDASEGFYAGHAEQDCRSLMNVTFRLPDDEVTSRFVEDAGAAGLTSLKGHRSVGGIRASIYNAMPMANVSALRDFMVDFRNRHA